MLARAGGQVELGEDAPFALASATIAFTDSFDSLFKLGSLLSIWAILVDSLAIRRREVEPETAKL